MLPEMPVTVMTYVPGVVPGFPPPPPPPPLPLPPHAPPTTEKSSTAIRGMLHRLRREAGMPRSRMQARAPLTHGRKYPPVRLRAGVADVVLTIRGVVCAAEPLMVTESGMLDVAGSLAALGVIAQLRLITPVNPSEGVKLMVDVFPVVAPGTTPTAVPVMEKLGVARLMVYTAVATALNE
jgi:hypothetical protein